MSNCLCGTIKSLESHRGENPAGNWTIKVSDLQRKNETGKFLGWRMKFWGTTNDASKAQKYELPLVDYVLPPQNTPPRPIIDTPTTTTEHSISTAFLPTGNSTSGGIQVWVSVVTSHKPYFGIIGIIIIFGICSGIYLLRRRAERLRSHYTTVSTREDVEVEEARRALPVSAGRHPRERISQGLGFHSSFLDDDDISTAGPITTPKYRDEPDDDVLPVVADKGLHPDSNTGPIGSGSEEHRHDRDVK